LFFLHAIPGLTVTPVLSDAMSFAPVKFWIVAEVDKEFSFVVYAVVLLELDG
jgi:hypothetical protein